VAAGERGRADNPTTIENTSQPVNLTILGIAKLGFMSYSHQSSIPKRDATGSVFSPTVQNSSTHLSQLPLGW